VGVQVTDSEDHPGWRKRLKDADSKQDIGGDFYTQKLYYEGFPSLLSYRSGLINRGSDVYERRRVFGPFWAEDARRLPRPVDISSTAAQLDKLGATAIAKCRPTNSHANLGVAIAELVREGVPQLAVRTWKRRTDAIRRGRTQQGLSGADKDISSDYLAYQFGFAPLGQEIGTFAAEVIRADELLAQYERDAGRVVRRRFEFPTKTETSTYTTDFGSYPYQRDVNPSDGINPSVTLAQQRSLRVVRETVQKRWFAGAFTYALPSWYNASDEMARKALLAKEILGLDLDEEVVWNLAPWSWAVDWFTNAGDVISNISSYREDGLLMRYGYMMEHTIVKETYTREYPNVYTFGKLDSAVTIVLETKLRRRANPFGFGLTWNGLSTFQQSILAALGISRRK
jgi:hypothetical protein